MPTVDVVTDAALLQVRSASFELSHQVDRRTPPSRFGLGPLLEAAESYERKRWQPGLAKSHPNIWRPDRSTHVVIAACRDSEAAYENNVGGVFTSALLRALYNHNPLGTTSYLQLIEIMGPVGAQQLPTVAGSNTNCLVFRIPQVELRSGENSEA